ncbi:MAG: hypothetical protein WCL32_26175 [Planctomycetota bacterium]
MSATPTFKRDTLKGRIIRKAIGEAVVAEAVGPITPGCEVYGLTMGKWSLVDLIEHCLRATGPADVMISTWTAAGADIGFANALLKNGAIKTLRFVVDSSFQLRQPAYCAALRAAFGDDSIRMTENHAKFVTIRNEKWNLVLRGSMNLNENRRLESFELSDCLPMAEFLEETIDALFAKQKDTFTRSRNKHRELFGAEWADGVSQDDGRFFDPSPLGVDLRRAGISYD